MVSETASQTSVKNQRSGQRRRRLHGAPAAAIAVSVLAAVPLMPAVAGAATIAEKRAEAARVAGQVSELENEFDHLQERFRGAQYRLRELDRRFVKISASVEKATRDLDAAEGRLVQRVVTVYKDGSGNSELVALARAGSFDTFLTRLETIEHVSGQDKEIVEEIRDLRAKVAARKR